MQPAAEVMDEALGKTMPSPFRLTLYANVTAAPVTDPAIERDLLVQQVTGRVRWRESVIAMKAAGIDRFVELGGKVVGPMIGRTVEDVTVLNAITMADIEALVKEI
jgi:[acyl-carrier-protein] S-malonyltransferase